MGLAGSITAARRRRSSYRGRLSLFSALSDAPSSVGRDASYAPERLERVRLLWNGSAEVPQGMLKDAKNLQTSKVAAK